MNKSDNCSKYKCSTAPNYIRYLTLKLGLRNVKYVDREGLENVAEVWRWGQGRGLKMWLRLSLESVAEVKAEAERCGCCQGWKMWCQGRGWKSLPRSRPKLGVVAEVEIEKCGRARSKLRLEGVARDRGWKMWPRSRPRLNDVAEVEVRRCSRRQGRGWKVWPMWDIMWSRLLGSHHCLNFASLNHEWNKFYIKPLHRFWLIRFKSRLE